MAKVSLKNVEKVYPNGFKAVHGINLDIKDGEFMVIVGPSGCAKSATLRMIAGLESTTKGEILIGNRIVNTLEPKDRDIAMVFQNYALYPHKTVYENMAFVLKLRKQSKKEINRRVYEVAEILNLTELLNRKPKQLSGGQMQRVAVGRAIVRHPQVFLFDEPLSNLDAKLRVQMRIELSKLHKRLKTTMIYVTHDQVEAMTMGDRLCVMDQGRIRQVDTPINLYNHPANAFVAGFIGSPSMNIIEATLVKDNNTCYVQFGNNKLRLPYKMGQNTGHYTGKQVLFGIRAEHIHFHKIHPEQKDNFIRTEILVVEHMGNDTYIYFTCGHHHYIARLSPSSSVRSGDVYDMWFNTQHCHLFDKESGDSLNPPSKKKKNLVELNKSS